MPYPKTHGHSVMQKAGPIRTGPIIKDVKR